MKKLRVFELAKKAGLKSQDLIVFLRRRGIEVKNHMSVIDEEVVAQILGIGKPKKGEQEVASVREEKEEVIIEVFEKEEEKEKVVSPAEVFPIEPLVEVVTEEKKEKPIHEKAKEKVIEEEKEKKREKEIEKEIHYPRRRRREEHRAEKLEGLQKVTLLEGATVGEFAEAIKRSPSEIIKLLMELGEFVTITQPIPPEAAQVIAESFGIEVEFKSPLEEVEVPVVYEDEEKYPQEPRPPVVTVMGHVDHGKTTLLDAIRKTDVVATEHGGITQHIGAYTVEKNGKTVTFIDTPGHEAFTAMRARGAQVTDVAVLVVAADDGVMPQTLEAIDHARAAEVPIMVAINKIDKQEANPDRVKQQLSDKGLVPEDWGGDTIYVPVSAKQGTNIDELLEMILLLAEMQDMKARKKGRARGIIIEAKLEKGRGPIATVLVKKGTLRVGDAVVCGTTYGKIRAMFDDKSNRVKQAGPGIPVEILGISEVPIAGNELAVVEDEKIARNIAVQRSLKARVVETMKRKKLSLEELFEKALEGEIEELNLVVKADTHGSLEAVKKALEELRVENVSVRIIHSGVGGITEADVMLASASEAIIIGFNVRPDSKAKEAATREKVEINTYRVIYELIGSIEAALKGLLAPEFVEEELGHAEIRKVFRISKIGNIAGCYVTDGKIVRGAKVRLVRQGAIVYEGTISSLKRFKEDASEVKQGFECGIALDGFQDVKEGDIIEAFQIVEKARD